MVLNVSHGEVGCVLLGVDERLCSDHPLPLLYIRTRKPELFTARQCACVGPTGAVLARALNVVVMS